MTEEQKKALNTPIMSILWGNGSYTRANSKMRKVCERLGVLTFLDLVQKGSKEVYIAAGELYYKRITNKLDIMGLAFGMDVSEMTRKPTPPTAEREVWLKDGHLEHFNGEINCPTNCDYCFDNCAWFRIHNGLAMCGNKIIGKIIEPPNEDIEK